MRVKRLANRGSNWGNGALAGVFALNLNNTRGNVNTNRGSRPALGESQKRQAHAAWRQYPLKRTRIPRPGET